MRWTLSFILLSRLELLPGFTACSAFSLVPSIRKTTQSTLPLHVQPSKWDNLVDEDDENDYDSLPVPPDMTYEPRNVKRAHESFLAIRGAGGKALTHDIYVREPNSDVFWYAGKVARVSDVSMEDCVARQWPMVEKHAANMRPIELFPQRGRLELWTAPGDSELDVAYNRPQLQMQQVQRPNAEETAALRKKIKVASVGFQGEVYQTGEDAFRTWRTNEGLPARPEINPGGETRPPTDDEYAEIQRQMQGQDVNAVFEEQERRTQEETM